MIKKIILCCAMVLCIAIISGCQVKLNHYNNVQSTTEISRKELTPLPAADQEKTNNTSVERELVEMKALHIEDMYEGGKIFLDISEDEMDFFESTIQNLDILDARKGKHANDIHSYNEGEEGLIYLNSIPEKNVYLYGYYTPQHLGHGLILDIGEEQTIYRFPFRYMTSHTIAPSISISEDESKLFISCLTGTGTGVSVSELYVFQIEDEETPFYVDLNKLVELFNNRITMSYDTNNKEIEIYSDGRHITTDSLGYGENPSQFYCGNFISYRIENDTVTVICEPSIVIENSAVYSYLKDSHLEAKIQFEYDTNGNIIDFDLGKIVAVKNEDITN